MSGAEENGPGNGEIPDPEDDEDDQNDDSLPKGCAWAATIDALILLAILLGLVFGVIDGSE